MENAEIFEPDTANGTEPIKKQKNIFPYIIRIITVPPLMALTVLTILYCHGKMFENIFQYLVAVFALTVLPTLAYPLQPILPKFRDSGRNGQRTLAMIMSVAGYLLGIIYALTFSVRPELFTLFLTYLISGIVLLVVNKVFGIKASGHSCGLMGPMAALAYFIGWPYLLIGAGLLGLMIWGSIKMKRHTPTELLIGGVIPVITLFVLAAVIL